MRFVVLGTGSIGQRHCRNLVTLGREVVAWDPDPQQRRQAAGIAGVAVKESLDDALRAAPEAAVICAPPVQHVDLANRALEAGAHVFVEKPIATTSLEVPGLIELAASRGKRLAVGMNLRFLPSLQRVAAMLAENRLGRVVALRAEFGGYLPDWRPGRDYRDNYAVSAAAGGGILLDAIHELDYLGWLFGETMEVSATAAHLSALAGDTEDLAELTIRFASGVLGQVHLDYLQRAYRRNLQVIGQAAVMIWDYPTHTVVVHGADGARDEEDFRAAEGEANDMYLDEMRHFIRCVEGRATPLVDGQEALRSLRLVEAAKTSSRARCWVTVE